MSDTTQFDDSPWSAPHIDSEIYLVDVVRTCVRAERIFDSDEEEHDFHTEIEDAVADHDPEMIFQSHPELERLFECDENAYMEAVYKIFYDECLADALQCDRYYDRGYDNYQGCWKEEEFNDPIDDQGAYFRELVAIAFDAIRDGNIGEVIDSLDAVIDESGLNFANDPETENWAQLLSTRNRENEGNANDESGDIRDRVIRAVNLLSTKLCELIANDPSALRHIEWRQLELLVATALEGLGLSVDVTPASKDDGKDIVVTYTISGTRSEYFVEIKHWRSGKKVDSPYVFDVIQVNLREKTAGGLYLPPLDEWCRSCLAEPRALIVRPRPPGGLEPPEPKVRQLGGSSPPSPLYEAASG
jgi:hypothetical protein